MGIRSRNRTCTPVSLQNSFRSFPPGQHPSILQQAKQYYSMESLSINSMAVKRTTISSRGGSSRSGSGVRLIGSTQYRMDETMVQDGSDAPKPVISKLKPTRCYRPKEWTPEVEEAFRVQQTGWRDVKEYMETYGPPERWDNGFIRCTRVKSNGYYTYWRTHRECDDKYLHTVKLFEYA